MGTICELPCVEPLPLSRRLSNSPLSAVTELTLDSLRPNEASAWGAWGGTLPDGPFPMWVFDRMTGAVLAANAAASEAYGYSLTELLSSTALELASWEGDARSVLAATHEDVALSPSAFQHRRSDGTQFQASTALVELGPRRGGIALVVVAFPSRSSPSVRDVSASSSPELPQFRTGATRAAHAHTLAAKTLLGSAGAFAMYFEPMPSSDVQERLERFEGARKRWSERVTTLRAMSQSAGTFVDIDPFVLARQVRERFVRRTASRLVDILLKCECDRVRVHPPSFEQALFELCDNAHNATRHRVPIVVNVQCTSNGHVLFQVSDEGKGMSRHILDGLGKPNESLLRLGAGLGIPFVWTVVEKHGGLLRFESARSVGTVASIWLPGGL